MAEIVGELAMILPMLSTDLAGVSTADKLAAAGAAARRLCWASRCWRHELATDLEAGQTNITLQWPMRANAIAIDVVVPRTDAFRVERDNLGRQVVVFNSPLSETVDALVRIKGCLIPVMDGDGMQMPEWIVEQYGEAIAAGATAMLKRHARKPYTDLNGAEYADREFRRGIGQAAIDAQKVGVR
jgi:hypothetical protein